MTDLQALKNALDSGTGIPFAVHGWQQTPDLPAWGTVTATGQADAIWSDDRMEEQALRGYVSLFSRVLDGAPARVQAVLDGLGLSWRLDAEDYEPDTRLMHYTWRWEEWSETPWQA